VPTHQLPSTQLNKVSPDALVAFSSNELVELWKEKHSFDLWMEIGAAALQVTKNKKVSDVDKLEALVKVGELALRIKRAGSTEKGGAVQVNVVTVDPTRR